MIFFSGLLPVIGHDCPADWARSEPWSAVPTDEVSMTAVEDRDAFWNGQANGTLKIFTEILHGDGGRRLDHNRIRHGAGHGRPFSHLGT